MKNYLHDFKWKSIQYPLELPKYYVALEQKNNVLKKVSSGQAFISNFNSIWLK